MDSPRGRIVLMKEGLREGSELSDTLVTHIDRCLSCMACVTACPSGVQYDKLIEDTRAQIERNYERPPAHRLTKRAIFELFPHPGRLRALVPSLAVAKALGLPRLARRPRGGPVDKRPGARTRRAGTGAVGGRGGGAGAGSHAGGGSEARARGLPPGLRPARAVPRRER